jgi:hypothetical protein
MFPLLLRINLRMIMATKMTMMASLYQMTVSWPFWRRCSTSMR